MEAQDQDAVSEPLPTAVGSLTDQSENVNTVEDTQVDHKAVETEERDTNLRGTLEKDSLAEVPSEAGIEDSSRGDVDTVQFAEQVHVENTATLPNTVGSESATELVTYEDNKHNSAPTALPSQTASTNALSTQTSSLDTYLTNDVLDIVRSQDNTDASISVPAKETSVLEKSVPISLEVQDVTATEETAPAAMHSVMGSLEANKDNTSEVGLTAATEGATESATADAIVEETIPGPTTNHDSGDTVADTLQQAHSDTPDVVAAEPGSELDSESQSTAEIVVEETSATANSVKTVEGKTVAETVSQLPATAEDSIAEPVAEESVTAAVDSIKASEPSNAPPSDATKTMEESIHAEQKPVEVASAEESAPDAINDLHTPAISESSAFVVEEAHDTADINVQDNVVPSEPSDVLSRDTTDVHAEQPDEALEELINSSVDDSSLPVIIKDTSASNGLDINVKDSVAELESLPLSVSTAEIVAEGPLHAEEDAMDFSPQEPDITADNGSQPPAINNVPASVIEESGHAVRTPAQTIIAEIESELSHVPPTEIIVLTEAATLEEPDTIANGSQSLATSEDPTVEELAHDIPQINSVEPKSSGVPSSDAPVLEDSVHAAEEGVVLSEPILNPVDSSQALAMSEEPTLVTKESALHTAEMHSGDNDARLVETPVMRDENNMTSDALKYSDSADSVVVTPNNSESQVLGTSVLGELTPAESGVESAHDTSNPDDEATVTADETQSASTDELTTEELATEKQTQSDPTLRNEEQLLVEVAGVSDLNDEENTPEDVTTIIQGVKDVLSLHDVATESDHDSGTVHVHTILESRFSPIPQAITEALATEGEPPSQTNPVDDESPVAVAETPSANKEDSIVENDPSSAPNESQLAADEAVLFEESIPANMTPSDSIVEEPNHDVDVSTTESAHQSQLLYTEPPAEDIAEKSNDSERPATSRNIEVEETLAPGSDDSPQEQPVVPDSVSQDSAAVRVHQPQLLGTETPKETAVDLTPSNEELSGATPEDIITEPDITHALDTEVPGYHHQSQARSTAQELLSTHEETPQVERETEIYPAALQADENRVLDDTMGEATVQKLHTYDADSDPDQSNPVKPEVTVTGSLLDHDNKADPATVQTSEALYDPDETVPSSSEAEQSTQPTEASDENAKEAGASVLTDTLPLHDQEAILIDEQPILAIDDSSAVPEQPSDVLLDSEAVVPTVDMAVTEDDTYESFNIPETDNTPVEHAPEVLPVEPHRSEPESQVVRIVSLEEDLSSQSKAVSPSQPDLSSAEEYIEPLVDNADVLGENSRTDYDEPIVGESTITDDPTGQPDLLSSVVSDVIDQEVGVESDTDAIGQVETDLASVKSHEDTSSGGSIEVTEKETGAEDDKGSEEENIASTNQPLDSRTETLAKVLAETPAGEPLPPVTDLTQAGNNQDVSSVDGELAESVLQLDEHAPPVVDSIEAIRTEVEPQTSFQQELFSATLSQTPVAATEVNSSSISRDSSVDASKGDEAAIDGNPTQVVVDAQEPVPQAQEDGVAFSEVTTYEKREESSLAFDDATQAKESPLNTNNALDLLTDPLATDQVFGTSSLLPSSVEIERPKSPWTPSYSVTTQGPGIVPEEEIETEILSEEPPTVSLTVSTESEFATNNSALEVDRPRSPWTPSYSVHVQGSPRSEATNIEVEPSVVIRDVLIETDVLKPIANDPPEHEEVQPEEHTQEPSEVAVDEEKDAVDFAPLQESDIAADNGEQLPAGNVPAFVIEESRHADRTPAQTIMAETEFELSHMPPTETIVLTETATLEEPDTTTDGSQSLVMSEDCTIEESAHDIPQINSVESKSSGVPSSDAPILEDSVHVVEEGVVLKELIPKAVDGALAMSEEPTSVAEESALHTHSGDNAGLVEISVMRNENNMTSDSVEYSDSTDSVVIAPSNESPGAANKIQFPRADDTNEPRPPFRSKPSLNVINENAEDNTTSQPLNVEISPSSPRSRLESTTSSLFFPGGWFAKNSEGRASLDNAHGEFIPAKPSQVTAQSDATPPANAHHGDAHGKKGKWCILM